MSPSSSAPGKLVLIIGPSGVGKSVILKSLRTRHPELHFTRSATTRERRKGEGTDLYCFVSDKEFDQLIEEGKVLEWAVVHGTERYGTLLDEIVPWIAKGKNVVREVDVQGFNSIRKHKLFRDDGAVHALQSIFILPEKREQLIAHIKKRAPMGEDELRRRIASMDSELDHAADCDVRIINVEGKLNDTIAAVEKAIFG